MQNARKDSQEGPLSLDQLSSKLLEIVLQLYFTPLASAGELAAFLYVGEASCYALLNELMEKGWMRAESFGWTKDVANRCWLSRPAVEALIRAGRVSGYGWYGKARMESLIRRFSVLEHCYSVAVDPEIIQRLGKFEQFVWLPDLHVDAAVRYEHGWVDLTWSGQWESPERLRRRMGDYWEAIKKRTDSDASMDTLPSVSVFVVPDGWQAELVASSLRWVNPAYGVLIYQVDEKRWNRYHDAVYDQATWPDVAAVNSVLGRRQRFANVEKLLEEQSLLDSKSILIAKVRSLLEQWPGVLVSQVKIMAHDSHQRVESALSRLKEREFARTLEGRMKDPREGGRARHQWFPTENTLDQAARRDRVEPSVPRGRVGQYGDDDWYKDHWMRHERGLIRLVTGFCREGFEVASGWRGVENFGQSGQLSPDAMVREPDGFVPGPECVKGKWHYLEYELSAQSASRLERKIRAYWHPLRRFPGLPVLFVCRNESSEETLHGQWSMKADEHTHSHSSHPGKLITTTVERLMRYGPVHPSVWRDSEGPYRLPAYRALEDAFLAIINALADEYDSARASWFADRPMETGARTKSVGLEDAES